MNRTMTLRRLPSADWLAFGVAMAAVFLKYLEPALLSIIALVVFLPSILREVGLLKDADEWTRGIMHRAGFHAALAVVGLMTLNYVAVAAGWFAPTEARLWPLGPAFFRLAVVWIFLVSYVIQYWGPAEGVFRILLVVALMNLAPVMVMARSDNTLSWGAVGPAAAIGTLLVLGLAFLVRRWPRAGGAVLALIVIAGFALGMKVMSWGDSRPWDFASSALQHLIIYGITGVALLRDTTGEGEPT